MFIVVIEGGFLQSAVSIVIKRLPTDCFQWQITIIIAFPSDLHLFYLNEQIKNDKSHSKFQTITINVKACNLTHQ